ncbi:unnamed protein product [Prorocentrum cordatum]|uniref:Ion transport domain-containing protein n=1 Tax=Prorocentrum cordatum TaxID=2364126 RepID=A0ABN9VBM8_9DINO|nr:unnamed protein product [Polarella glacialis]
MADPGAFSLRAAAAGSADCVPAPAGTKCVPEALERLMLDVEEVLDRHRVLCGDSPARSSAYSVCRVQPVCGSAPGLLQTPPPMITPAPPQADAAEHVVVVTKPSSPLEVLSASPPAGSPVRPESRPSRGSSVGSGTWARSPTHSRRERSRVSSRKTARETSTSSGATDAVAEAASRLRNNGFTRGDTGRNWMHTLVEDSSTSMSQRWSLVARWGSRVSDAAARIYEGASRATAGSARARKLVRHPAYQLARAMVIVLDAVLVVCEMESAGQRASSGPYYSAASVDDVVIFTVLLDISCGCVVVDHLLRFVAGEVGAAYSAGAGWQSFHAVVAVTQLLQTIAHHSHRHQRSSQFRVVLAMLSTLRLARVLSVVLVTSVIRQHRFFRELRIMVHALAGAVKVLLWSSLLIFTFLLIFGVVLSEGTLAFLVEHEWPTTDDVPGDLQDRFGSLFDAVLTLFQSMSGGVDWEGVWNGLGAVGAFYRGVYLIFIEPTSDLFFPHRDAQRCDRCTTADLSKAQWRAR